jgi:hypothetical protein
VLQPLWQCGTFVLVTLGWIPFRAADFAGTRDTLFALAQAPDTTLLFRHPAIAVIPLASLLFCLIDRDRRFQDWLVERARFRVAVAASVMAVLALEVFAQIDTQIPFVYFQF